MNLKLFEVAGTHIFSMSAIVMVLFFVFAIIVVGYLLGKINIKGVSLGTAAIFLVALVVGHFKGVAFGENGIAAWIADVEAQDAVNFYFKLIQSFGLILFVTSVGLIAGPTFFKNLKKNAKSYVLLGAVIIAAGAGVCALITLLVPGMNSAMSVGLLSGALTSTPAFAAALVMSVLNIGYECFIPIRNTPDILDAAFGVIGVVLFVQIIPKVLKANMAEERAKLASVDTGDDSPLKQKKLFEMDKFGLGAFALTVLTGAILGCINIPLGAGSFNLGTTGGPLIMGLVFGHFGRIGKLSMKVNKHLLEVFQEWGLVLFLIGAGVDGGAGFVQTLEKYGPLLFLWGALMTIVPLFIGFFLAKKVLKLSLFNNLGSITGGMTSTPALGALINTSGTPNVASAYAATYPIALVLVVLASQFLTYL